MRIRGDVFWDWADQTLHHRTHDETLDDGTFIDVQCDCRVPAVRKCSLAYTRHRAWRYMRRLLTRDPANR